MLLPLLLAISLSARAAKPEPTLQEEFDQGVRAMNRSNYTKALEIFNKIRIYHRDDPLSVRAELAIADVYYKKGDWDQARLSYEDWASLHPKGIKSEECQPYNCLDYVFFRMGSTLAKKAPKAAGRDQTWTVKARETWRNFDKLYPKSEHAAEVAEFLAEAEERLAKKELVIARFYERREAWPAVQARALGMVKTYPSSASLPEAMGLLRRALDAQGPENRAAVLAELESRAGQLDATNTESAKAAAANLRLQTERLRQ